MYNMDKETGDPVQAAAVKVANIPRLVGTYLGDLYFAGS